MKPETKCYAAAFRFLMPLALALLTLVGAKNSAHAQTATPTPTPPWVQNGTNISNTNGGNVGIGTANPGAQLDVRGNIAINGAVPAPHAATNYSALWLKNNVSVISEVASGYSVITLGTNYQRSGGTWTNVDSALPAWSFSMGAGPGYDQFALSRSSAGTYSPSTVFMISSLGNVGIGTNSPTRKLDVAGDINARGAITGTTINATYQDVAEWVPSTQNLQAGTVVVLDADRNNHVLASTRSYDTRVAGVVSASPGVILGEEGEGKLKVATTGRVKVVVDATRAPIKVGDLLVTSDLGGAAMKSIPIDLGGALLHRPGTIIGKALEPLASGKGEILVLLSLQ